MVLTDIAFVINSIVSFQNICHDIPKYVIILWLKFNKF